MNEILYNLPYINGQYYFADNGNYSELVYELHNPLFSKKDKNSSLIKNIVPSDSFIMNIFSFDFYKDFNEEFKEYKYIFSLSKNAASTYIYKKYNIRVNLNDFFDNREQLEKNNYYFFGGYRGHCVLVYKYNNFIIIGNVGGGIDTTNIIKIDNKNLVRAVYYYEFKIEHIYFLYTYRHVMFEEHYKNYLSKMEKDEIKFNKSFNEKDLQILNYKLKLEPNFFYLQLQDEGTCTWHSTLLLDIFENYYLSDNSINLVEHYEKKKKNTLEWLNEDKFKKFSIDNINLLLIKYLGLGWEKDLLKENLLDYFKKGREYEYDEIKSLESKKFKFNNLFMNEKIIYRVNKKDVMDTIYKYINNSKDINVDIDHIILIHNIKKILEEFDNCEDKNDYKFINFTYQERLYDTNLILYIYVYQIFKMFDKENILVKEFNKFYEKKENINKLNTFLKRCYPNIEIDKQNINIVYSVLKISFYFFQFEIDDNGNITSSYSNIYLFIKNNKLYDILIQNYNEYYQNELDNYKGNNVDNINYIQGFIYKNGSFGFINKIKEYHLMHENEEWYKNHEYYTKNKEEKNRIIEEFNSNLKINPVLYYNNKDNLLCFFISLVYRINYKIILKFSFGENSSINILSKRHNRGYRNQYSLIKEKNILNIYHTKDINPYIYIYEDMDKYNEIFYIEPLNYYNETIVYNYPFHIKIKKIRERSIVHRQKLDDYINYTTLGDNYMNNNLYNENIYDIITKKEIIPSIRNKYNEYMLYHNENNFKSFVNHKLLSYTNFFIDFNNIDKTHNFNIDLLYKDDELLNLLKIDTDFKKLLGNGMWYKNDNCILINLVNKLFKLRFKRNKELESFLFGETDYFKMVKYNYYYNSSNPLFNDNSDELIDNVKKYLKIKDLEVKYNKFYINNKHVSIEQISHKLFFIDSEYYVFIDKKIYGYIVDFNDFYNIIKYEKMRYFMLSIYNKNKDIFFIKNKDIYYYIYENILIKYDVTNNDIYINDNKIDYKSNNIISKIIECYNNIFLCYNNKLLLLPNLLDDNIKYPIFKDKYIYIGDCILLNLDDTLSIITNNVTYKELKIFLHFGSIYNDHFLVKLIFNKIKYYKDFYKDFKMYYSSDYKIGSIYVRSIYEYMNKLLYRGGGKLDYVNIEHNYSNLIIPKIYNKINFETIKLEKKYKYKNLRKFVKKISKILKKIDTTIDDKKITKGNNIIKRKFNENNINDNDVIEYIQRTYFYKFSNEHCIKFKEFFKDWNKKSDEKYTEYKDKIIFHNYFEVLYNKSYVNIIYDNIDDYIQYIEWRQIKLFFKKCFNYIKTCEDFTKLKICLDDLIKYYFEINIKDKSFVDILFELYFEGVIFQKQKNFIEEYYKNVKESDNKNKIYQLLPGWGKTKMLTPYLILDILIGKRKIFKNEKKQIFVILPDHLVLQSFEAINNILYNYDINVKIIDFDKNFSNYMSYKKSLNRDDYIFSTSINDNVDVDVCIFSTNALQYYILIKNIEDIKKINLKNIYWIFDEVDFKTYSESEFNLSKEKILDPELKDNIINYIEYVFNNKDIENNKYIELLKKYNKDAEEYSINEKYGLGIKEDGEVLIVPYKSVNTPMIESSFSNIWFTINLNLFYYKNNSIHDNDLKIIIEDEMKKLTKYPTYILSRIPNLFTDLNINSQDTYFGDPSTLLE
jgi:hypothetical protein